ncbi:hypothetical protein [Nocardioides marmorisolisilvae]|uniref:hypothetical protein n=1 Tax=Nocardioides marmorisolisilvae TaxID=1542737 RepID=UPI0011CD8D91|nr:hypothetical protein [Nocardioides marmorisolisilvae]
MSRAVLVALLLLATGCGSAKPHQKADPGGHVTLEAICPGAHQVYDGLVASNPASQTAYVDHLASLRKVGDSQARDALDPVISAAKTLAAAGRGPKFDGAQDGVYQSIVGLDKACRAAGSYILH